MPVCRY